MANGYGMHIAARGNSEQYCVTGCDVYAGTHTASDSASRGPWHVQGLTLCSQTAQFDMQPTPLQCGLDCGLDMVKFGQLWSNCGQPCRLWC